MATEEFNALPLEARRYIEKQQGCASCGNSKSIDVLYKNYIIMSKQALFTLRLGAVLYKKEDGTGGILYPIHPKDSDDVVKEKLATALAVYTVSPKNFSDIQEEKIAKILNGTQEEETQEDETQEEETQEDETQEGKPTKRLYGAAKAAADKKAKSDDDDLE